MDARAKTVREILQAGDQYLIPFFQRYYSWSKENWTRLKDDIWELLEQKDTTLHFMGPLVCTRAPSLPTEIPAYQLIDGQQRLTTITIFLCALRDSAAAHGQTDFAAEIQEDYLIHKRKSGPQRYKVMPRLGDREVLTGLIDGKHHSHSDTNIHRALNYFRGEIEDWAQADATKLRQLFNAVTARLSLVVITIESENPYEIFESLNATGLPLEQADLIRNFVFMQVEMQKQEAFHFDSWKPYEEMFAAEGEDDALDPDDFYRAYLMRDGAYINSKAVYMAFKEQFKKSGRLPEQLVDELKRFANYEIMLTRPHTAAAPDLRGALETVADLDVTTAHPLLMALLDMEAGGRLARGELIACLTDLASFVLRRTVCGESTRTYGLWFAEAIRAIEKSPREDLKKYWLRRGWPDDAAFLKSLEVFPIYRRERFKAHLMLRAVEGSFGHKEPVDLSKLSIEHVMPQSIRDDKAGRSWKEMLGEGWHDVQAKLLHVLGNLTLTGYNPDLSNSAYETKKKLFAKSNVRLNEHFEDVQAWDEDAIQKRGRALGRKLAEIWPRPATSEAYVIGGSAEYEEDPGRTPEQVERFFELYEKIRPELNYRIFPREDGWTRHKSERWCCACYGRWDDRKWEGFILQDDDEVTGEDNRILLGVLLDEPQHFEAFRRHLRENEAAIRKTLGAGVEIDYENQWYPIYEYVDEKAPEKVIARIKLYKQLFEPVLAKIIPPLKSKKDRAAA